MVKNLYSIYFINFWLKTICFFISNGLFFHFLLIYYLFSKKKLLNKKS